MFWTYLKWGGTAAMLIIVAVLAIMSNEGKQQQNDGQVVLQPAPEPQSAEPSVPTKKFNF